ncbi:ribonuclease [Geodermatophilus sp. Leaf369]|uniref:Rne/Rng family ribonuclease n=1 Tax=Geodermatophilus sp. Leaf369 TaxID=1736354 RepID=UPI0006F64695|nr:Rne/Rng family ribonuclease [Geodermatophilus sp. Leaf369]KQS59949.1 ribonuclease [Geodermatophilus sp. Leaf369]
MADDQTTPETPDTTPENDPAQVQPAQLDPQAPADAEGDEEAPADLEIDPEAPADADPAAVLAEEPAPEPAPEPETEPRLRADAETLEAAAIPPSRSTEAPSDAEAPRFGAQFSSPEPTSVTARPRRRATRPALAADPDSVEPAPAAAPTRPAFVSFVAPAAEAAEAAPAPRRRSRRAQAETPAEAPVESPAQDDAPAAEREDDRPAEKPARRSRSRRKTAAERAAEAAEAQEQEETEPVVLPAPGDAEDTAAEDTTGEESEDTDDDGEDSDDASAGSRRRRRGRRGRGRGRNDEDDADRDESAADQGTGDSGTDAESEDDAEDADGADAEDGQGSSTRRRRRRRRRGESTGATADTTDSSDDDRPERAGRNGRDSSDDAVRGVAGSTRLEAKRQRRRDGRDTGRKRAPILSESEFLARREAVDRAMVIRQQGDRTQIAVLEDDVLVEHYVTQAQSASFAGNVYLGRVQNVLPSMEAAFVDVGKGRNAVLYAGEVNWETAGLSGKSRSIEQALKSGDKVLVQVTKDPIGHKGARLTQQINLPGRFLVYVPGGSMTGISRKLPDNERQRLKDILKKIVPEDAGVIIRTAAEGASEEELTRDVARLQAQWEVIQTKAKSTSTAPTLLYGEPDLAIRVIRDVFNEDFKRLVVQGSDAWDTVEAYVAHVSPELSERLSRYTGNGDVFRELRVDEQLLKALDRKVWLPSGGSLVIDRTEAMTVVDVNTGKFTGSGGNLEQTVTRNNIEAAEEIVRQLRLRDIGGMIVIDFIDMVLESNRELVLRRLTECLGRDRTKHQVAEVTSLGLVQMTRKRVGQGLLEVFSEPCEHCRGRGVVVHLDPVDEKKRSGGSPVPAPSAPNGNGSNGSGSTGNGRRGNGTPSAPEVVEEVPAAETPAASTDEEQPQESSGRSGRRSRGRRNRGQSGEARAAEDAAVLAGARGDDGDTPAPPVEEEDGQLAVDTSETELELPPAADAVTEDTAATSPEGDAAPEPDEQPQAELPVDEVPVEEAPVEEAPAEAQVEAPAEPEAPVEQEPEPQPAPVEAAAPARPRRRRAASRPAGPPA